MSTGRGDDWTGVDFLGHACVRLTSRGGQTLLIDPYESGGLGGAITYSPIEEGGDWVHVTHAHEDHAAVEGLPGSSVLVEEDGEWGDFRVARWTLDHDEYDGRRRGGRVSLTKVCVDEWTVIHLSDVGQSAPVEVPSAWRFPDVLLATCGGFYTIGAAQADMWRRRLAATMTIPIHYKTSACDLPLRPREHFSAHAREVEGVGASNLKLDRRRSMTRRVLVALEPRYGNGDGADERGGPFHAS